MAFWADEATRSTLEENALTSSWWEEHEFLRWSEDRWPEELPSMVAMEEIRPVRAQQAIATTSSLDWSRRGRFARCGEGRRNLPGTGETLPRGSWKPILKKFNV